MAEIVIEEDWRDRILGLLPARRHAWIVPALVLGLVLVGIALWARGRAPQIAAPATSVAAGAVTPGAAQPQAPATGILVHVAGAVRRPGLYEMAAGARVADAIELAGGPRRVADLDVLNLAEVLIDGAKIEVPRRGAAPTPAAPAAPSGSTGLVSLNNADVAALEMVPGIGPVKAAAIVEFRARIGGFDSIEQLLDVDGIGPATLESLRPYVTL